MKITLSLHNIVCYIIIIALSYFLFFKSPMQESGEVDRIKSQRDSIVTALIVESKVKELAYWSSIDSLRGVIRANKQADSINHYKSLHDKNRIPHLTPDGRKSLRDSLFRANGL